MRIAFFTEEVSSPGGTSRVTCGIANALAEAGYDVRIVTIDPGGAPFFALSDKVQLDSLGLGCNLRGIKKLFFGIWALRKWLTTNSMDVVVGVDTILFLYILPAAVGLPLSAVAWEQFNWKAAHKSVARRVARRLAARWADSVVVLSNRDKAQWERHCGSATRLKTIYNTDPYDGNESTARDADSGDNVVLACGALDYRKGFDLALKAWALIPGDVRLGWKLRILGEGIERSSLERLRDDLGVGAEVELPGATMEMAREYAAARMFILSSRYEGFGMVLLEALHFGLPCVAFDCDCGPAEILSKGGLLVPPEDVKTLASSMERLMRDGLEREVFSFHARQDASRFSIDVVIGQWQSLFKELAETTRL